MVAVETPERGGRKGGCRAHCRGRGVRGRGVWGREVGRTAGSLVLKGLNSEELAREIRYKGRKNAATNAEEENQGNKVIENS